jgi:uncharacterized protein (TIGR02444 family)
MSATETSSSQGSPFWRFSLAFYRRPKVADACIALQEEAGVDVNLLLFLLWQATLNRKLSAAEVSELESRIAPWREMTVVPLRAVRRALKAFSGKVDTDLGFTRDRQSILPKSAIADLGGFPQKMRPDQELPLVAAATAELFRTRIKAVELEAERLQQEAMYELAGASPLGHPATSVDQAARANVAAYQAIGRAAFPAPVIEILLAALSGSGLNREG